MSGTYPVPLAGLALPCCFAFGSQSPDFLVFACFSHPSYKIFCMGCQAVGQAASWQKKVFGILAANQWFSRSIQNQIQKNIKIFWMCCQGVGQVASWKKTKQSAKRPAWEKKSFGFLAANQWFSRGIQNQIQKISKIFWMGCQGVRPSGQLRKKRFSLFGCRSMVFKGHPK